MFTHYIHPLKQSDLFAQMATSEILETLSHLSATVHTYAKDEVICFQGKPFSKLGLVLEGKVQCQKSHLTQDIIDLNIFSVSDSFGEDIIYSGHLIMPYSIYALQECTLLFINSEHLFSLTSHSSKCMCTFLTNLLCTLSKRSLSASIQIELSRIPSLKKRVALFLLHHYECSGQPLFRIPLSRYEMANYLSVTRPALSKVLSELKRESIIDYYKDSFKIENLQALTEQ